MMNNFALNLPIFCIILPVCVSESGKKQYSQQKFGSFVTLYHSLIIQPYFWMHPKGYTPQCIKLNILRPQTARVHTVI